MIVVANAAPLTALGRVNRLDLPGGGFEAVRTSGNLADEVIGTGAAGGAGRKSAVSWR